MKGKVRLKAAGLFRGLGLTLYTALCFLLGALVCVYFDLKTGEDNAARIAGETAGALTAMRLSLDAGRTVPDWLEPRPQALNPPEPVLLGAPDPALMKPAVLVPVRAQKRPLGRRLYELRLIPRTQTGPESAPVTTP